MIKTTLEFPSEDVAEQAVKALLNEAYCWEEKRQYYKEQYESQNIPSMGERRRAHRLEFLARREAECKAMSDELYKIAEAIRSVIREEA